MRRRQAARLDRDAHVVDAEYLGYRPLADGHQAGCHQGVAPLSGGGHGVELTGYQLGATRPHAA